MKKSLQREDRDLLLIISVIAGGMGLILAIKLLDEMTKKQEEPLGVFPEN